MGDDRVLSITGQRQTGNEEYSFTSKFSQSFYLDRTAEVEKLTAHLENGVLVVSAPKDHKRLEIGIRKIPIQQVEASPEEEEDVTTTASVSEKVELHTEETMHLHQVIMMEMSRRKVFSKKMRRTKAFR